MRSTSKPLMPGRRTSSSIRSTSSRLRMASAASPRRRAQHAVVAPEDGGQRVAHPLVVVDDEDRFRLGIHGESSRHCIASRATLRALLDSPAGPAPEWPVGLPRRSGVRSSAKAGDHMANEFDVVVIGAGTGGYVAAIRAAQLGLKAAVVEKQKALGGTCLIWGCIPTKALLEHAHALKVVQNAKEWGVTIGEGAVGIDMNQVQARKDKIVDGPHQGRRVPVQEEQDRLDQGHRAPHWAAERSRWSTATRRALTAGKEIVIATGSAPRSVPGIEIDRKRIITSDEAIALREVPKSMVILGSGAVGVEFASIFRRFGSEVTIIELLPRLVPVEDEAVSAELEKSFKKQGITVHTGTKVTKATAGRERRRRRGAAARRQDRDDQRRLPARCDRPRTGHAGLGVEGLGLKLDRGYITVDELFRTSVPGISAVGDVITLGAGGGRIRSSRTCRRPKASSPPSGLRGRT